MSLFAQTPNLYATDTVAHNKITTYMQAHYPACVHNIHLQKLEGFLVRCNVKTHPPMASGVIDRKVVKVSNEPSEIAQPDEEISIWREVFFDAEGNWLKTTTIVRDLDCELIGETDCNGLTRARVYCRESLKKSVLGAMRIVEEASGNRYFILSTISGDVQFDALGKILSPTKP